MPTWLVPTLKWGGIALAVIAALAIIYVQFIALPLRPRPLPLPTRQRRPSIGFCCWSASWRLLQGS